MDKKTLFIIAPVLFVLVFVVTFLITPGEKVVNGKTVGKSTNSPKTTPGTLPVVDEDPGPKTEPCPLNGALYSKARREEWEKRRPMGVQIENSLDSRPQSGLSSADVVYEAVAEGGITRFLAVFYCKVPDLAGPVRSARIYFMRILKEYGQYPLYAHVGGANTPGPADALGTISKWKWSLYNDLNQFSVPFPIYYRDYERLPNVATEHTVYARMPKLFDYAAKKRKLTNVDEKGNPWDKGFTKWQFKDDAPAGERGAVKKITYSFWQNNMVNDFAVEWEYDTQNNSYKRVNGGLPHKDKNTDKQLEAKNVVIMYVKESLADDGYEGPGKHVLYDLKGTGNALIFQNGQAIKGKWSKASDEGRTKFTDEKGKEISFVRGQIFVSILDTKNNSVKYE